MKERLNIWETAIVTACGIVIFVCAVFAVIALTEKVATYLGN